MCVRFRQIFIEIMGNVFKRLFRGEEKGADVAERLPMSIITLPQDTQVVLQLRKKLESYIARLNRQGSKSDDPSSREFRESIADTRYKIKLLSALFEGGSVDIFYLSTRIRDEDGEIFEDAFRNASGVIRDYAETGGKNVIGGAGLNIKP